MKNYFLFLWLGCCFFLIGCGSGSGTGGNQTRSSGNVTNTGDRDNLFADSSGTSGSGGSNTSSNNSNSNAAPDWNALEAEAFALVNNYRSSNGLQALQWDNTIASVCRTHSNNMANGSASFSHDGFEQRVSTLQAAIGGTSFAENLAFNQGYDDPADRAVNGWINSPGHEANMRGNYTKSGMGVSVTSSGQYYFTQIFVR